CTCSQACAHARLRPRIRPFPSCRSQLASSRELKDDHLDFQSWRESGRLAVSIRGVAVKFANRRAIKRPHQRPIKRTPHPPTNHRPNHTNRASNRAPNQLCEGLVRARPTRPGLRFPARDLNRLRGSALEKFAYALGFASGSKLGFSSQGEPTWPQLAGGTAG